MEYCAELLSSEEKATIYWPWNVLVSTSPCKGNRVSTSTATLEVVTVVSFAGRKTYSLLLARLWRMQEKIPTPSLLTPSMRMTLT